MRSWPIVLVAISLCTACNVQVDVIPTSTSQPTVTPAPTEEIFYQSPGYHYDTSRPWPTISGVPIFEAESYAPYRLVAVHPHHDQEMWFVFKATQVWNTMSGTNLFDDTSSNLIAMYFQDDPECNGNLDANLWSQPNQDGYVGIVHLCVREFLIDDGCLAPVEHELGHILLLADNTQPGSVGVMSYWMGHTKDSPGISFNQWCHNPILPKEAEAVRELNSTE
jgi:hypothetical protein